MSAWRMMEKCDNCPFHTKGPGLALRKSLRPGRFAAIKRELLRGQLFECHKTVGEDGEGESLPGTGLLCAGAYAFMEKHQVNSQFVRICERMDQREKNQDRHRSPS